MKEKSEKIVLEFLLSFFLPFSSFRSLASSLSHLSTSGFAALSLCEGWNTENNELF